MTGIIFTIFITIIIIVIFSAAASLSSSSSSFSSSSSSPPSSLSLSLYVRTTGQQPPPFIASSWASFLSSFDDFPSLFKFAFRPLLHIPYILWVLIQQFLGYAVMNQLIHFDLLLPTVTIIFRNSS
ncbi:hypothetical protein ElyMa_000142700 [Elysia marginata]|uniref:Uncharacterized protein n=1 Tax=Elysia marginata TaxID=1093978 RepID=A0AAV4EP86_9GAST|nr:hypothetical protein ElyMa_000142700 [Elysia marginata]